MTEARAIPRLLEADEIETRVSKYIDGKGASLLLYKTARVDMDILDETYGADAWQNDYREIKGVLFCGIAVDGIWKWDCGVESNAAAEKGEASDAFKRAGFRWGIGRELYSAPSIWISERDFETKIVNGKKQPKDRFIVDAIKYNAKRKICFLQIKNASSKKVVFTYGKASMADTPEQANASGVKRNPVCELCGAPVAGYGKNPPAAMWKYTKSKYGKGLCAECAKKVAAVQEKKASLAAEPTAEE